ncbi:MAG: ATP-binding protein [Lautropia sp.]
MSALRGGDAGVSAAAPARRVERRRRRALRAVWLGVALALMIANVALNLESDRRAATSAAGIARDQRVLEAIDGLRRGAQRAQAAAFGFVVGGGEDALRRYRSAAQALADATRSAESLVVDDDATQARFDELRARLASELEALEALAGSRAPGVAGPPGAETLAHALQQRSDAVGALLDELGAATERALDAKAAAREVSLRMAEWSGVAGNVAGVASIVVLALMWRRVERRRRVERARFDDQFDALRSPLEQVRDGLQRLRAQGRDPRALQQTGARLDTQIARLVERVDDVVDLGRLEAGSLTLERERVDIAFILRDAVAGLDASLAERRHRPRLALPAEPIVVLADRRRLTQVFAKLLDNASRHTGAGGVIEVTAEQVGERVVVRVRDEGAGMSTAHIAAIFDDRRAPGTAVGRPPPEAGSLRLARALLGLHGGSLEARSAGIGRGTECIVRLPVFEEPDTVVAASNAPVAAAPKAITGVVRRVLVVDPLAASAASTLLLLRVSGQDVRHAPDLAAALRALERFDPDAVLIDAGAPGASPYPLAGELRRAWRRRHPRRPLRIVALVDASTRQGRLASVAGDAIARLVGRRVDVWLGKPISQSELLAAIG